MILAGRGHTAPRPAKLPVMGRFDRGVLSSLFGCAAVGLGVLLVAWPGAAQANKGAPLPIAPLPLSIAVATEPTDDGEHRAVDDAWLDAQVAAAEALFGPHGVHFVKAAARPLAGRFARLETRADRDALSKELAKGVVNVFVVASLRDVDDPSRLRMGVHWRPKGDERKHYVIVAASAQPTTLAHELGHFFGNGHSKVRDNLMSYDRSGAEVFLDADQVRRIQSFARIYVRSRELLPVTPPP